MIANIDTFVFTIDFDDYENICKPLLYLLDDKKQQAKKNMVDSVGKKVTVEIGNMEFEVLPNGTRMHAYILHNDLYEVHFSRYRAKAENMFPVFVRIKSECLWSKGFSDSVNFIRLWAVKNIGEIKTTKISRADLCCHTDAFRFNFNDIDRFKTRCRQILPYLYDRVLSSLNFGSRDTQKVYCRIYDKSLEIATKRNKTWFKDIWQSKGLDPDNVWNIEFELHREFFTEYHIDTVDDFMKNIKSIWQYLTRDWLALIDENENYGDRKHIDRCALDVAWGKLVFAFDVFMGSAMVKRVKQLSHDASAMIPQILGCITSFAAKINKNDFDLVIPELFRHGLMYYDGVKDSSFKLEVKKKRKLLYAFD